MTNPASEQSGPPNPADRKLQTRKKETRTEGAKLSTIFVGLALRILGPKLEYVVVIHDGIGAVGFEHDTRNNGPNVMDRILERAKEYCQARGHKISLFAVAGPLDDPLGLPDPGIDVDRDAPPSFLARIWMELDAIPFLIPCRDTQFSLEGEAVRAVETALTTLHPTATNIIRATASQDKREVEVDAAGKVHLYDLSQQAALTSPKLWKGFTSLATTIKKNKIRISFFSATPQGGGVALMRHALIRIWRMAKVDFKWYVPQGDSSVFDITKRKFHNVLQGVAPADVRLLPENKELFEKWTNWNYDTYWKGDGGPASADVVIIDDPQLTALIPRIKKDYPNTKLIYRSHIQIRSDLTDKPGTPQAEVWDYLFNFIKDTDLFVSHPVEEFVPKNVWNKLPVVYMPPSTDCLDGLNKPLPEDSMDLYKNIFGDLISASTGQVVDWSRGYVLQVARFDPSKGIPYLVDGYRLWREKLKQEGSTAPAPQLILTGHGSVDDPDGTWILHKLQEMVATPQFAEIKKDIFAVRAPPDDRLLDALMRGCDVACQVSTREGYEIKVTEAIHKGKWIIATKAGGIPLQVRDGIDGRLVEAHSAQSIADALDEFYKSPRAVRGQEFKSKGGNLTKPLGGRWDKDGEGAREELFAIGNCTMWQFLVSRVLGLPSWGVADHHQQVYAGLKIEGRKDLWELNKLRVWEDLLDKNLPQQ